MGKIKILQEEKLALFGNNRQSLLKVLVNVTQAMFMANIFIAETNSRADFVGFGYVCIKKLSLEEILISQGFCRQPEHHAAVRTHDVLAVFAAAAYVFQISAAANGLHNGE